MEGSTSSASMWNFSAISRCHCSARCGGHSTARRVLSGLDQLRAIRRASMVLPMPMASAISSRTVSWRSAMSSGTSW